MRLDSHGVLRYGVRKSANLSLDQVIRGPRKHGGLRVVWIHPNESSMCLSLHVWKAVVYLAQSFEVLARWTLMVCAHDTEAGAAK